MNRVHTNPQLYSFQQCVRKSYFCKIFDFRKGEGQSYRWFFFVSIPCLVLKKIFCGNKCTLVSKIKVNYTYVYMYDLLSDKMFSIFLIIGIIIISISLQMNTFKIVLTGN